jgi:hypothetical protein
MLAGLAAPAPASASCAATVVVDGRVLYGSARLEAAPLPALGGRRKAIEPACHDYGGSEEKDRPTKVVTIRGIPPTVAVMDPNVPMFFIARGSMPQMADHPLHRSIYNAQRPPTFRQKGRCRPHRSPIEVVAGEPASGFTGFRATQRSRHLFVSVDSKTRLTNRPPYEPVFARQRLRLHTSKCGPRRVADRITFVGPTIEPESSGLSDARLPRDYSVAAIVGWVLLAGGAAMGFAWRARRSR